MAAGPSSRSTFFFSDVQINSEHCESLLDRARRKVLECPFRLFDNNPSTAATRILTYFPF